MKETKESDNDRLFQGLLEVTADDKVKKAEQSGRLGLSKGLYTCAEINGECYLFNSGLIFVPFDIDDSLYIACITKGDAHHIVKTTNRISEFGFHVFEHGQIIGDDKFFKSAEWKETAKNIHTYSRRFRNPVQTSQIGFESKEQSGLSKLSIKTKLSGGQLTADASGIEFPRSALSPYVKKTGEEHKDQLTVHQTVNSFRRVAEGLLKIYLSEKKDYEDTVLKGLFTSQFFDEDQADKIERKLIEILKGDNPPELFLNWRVITPKLIPHGEGVKFKFNGMEYDYERSLMPKLIGAIKGLDDRKNLKDLTIQIKSMKLNSRWKNPLPLRQILNIKPQEYDDTFFAFLDSEEGRWKKIPADLYKSRLRFIKSRVVDQAVYHLPKYKYANSKPEKEGDYNERSTTEISGLGKSAWLIDKIIEFTKPDGENVKFEIGDILIQDDGKLSIICVKAGGSSYSSATLSHLSAQTALFPLLVTSEWASLPGFIGQCQDKVKFDDSIKKKLLAGEFEMVLAIYDPSGPESKHSLESLPYFTVMNLFEQMSMVEQKGFMTKFVLIQKEENSQQTPKPEAKRPAKKRVDVEPKKPKKEAA